MQAVEKALDVIRCYCKALDSEFRFQTPISEIKFKTQESKFRIALEHYLIVDSEGKELYETSTSSLSKWYGALDFEAENFEDIITTEILRKIEDFLFSAQEELSDIEIKIINSLRWYRKGEETNIPGDKLLDYWIVIENFVNFRTSSDSIILQKGKKENTHKKENICFLAKEFIAAIESLDFVYETGLKLFHDIKNLINSYFDGRQLLCLPKALIELCTLNSASGEENLQSFISNLPKLRDSVKRKIIKDKIASMEKFYSDGQFAKEQIQHQINLVKDDILLIYRYRNRIVHNAHFDNTVLPYYIQKARKYSGDLLREIIRRLATVKGESIEEILLKSYVRMNRLMQKLEQSKQVDLLNLDF